MGKAQTPISRTVTAKFHSLRKQNNNFSNDNSSQWQKLSRYLRLKNLSTLGCQGHAGRARSWTCQSVKAQGGSGNTSWPFVALFPFYTVLKVLSLSPTCRSIRIFAFYYTKRESNPFLTRLSDAKQKMGIMQLNYCMLDMKSDTIFTMLRYSARFTPLCQKRREREAKQNNGSKSCLNP